MLQLLDLKVAKREEGGKPHEEDFFDRVLHEEEERQRLMTLEVQEKIHQDFVKERLAGEGVPTFSEYGKVIHPRESDQIAYEEVLRRWHILPP